MAKNEKEKENEIVMIDGTEYYFDLRRILEFVTNRSDKSDKEKEVVDNYEYTELSEAKLSSKMVRELTTPNYNPYDNVKYDLLKMLIIQVITYADKAKLSNDGIEIPIININFMPLGTRMVFNTLENEGILIKKENKQ